MRLSLALSPLWLVLVGCISLVNAMTNVSAAYDDPNIMYRVLKAVI